MIRPRADPGVPESLISISLLAGTAARRAAVRDQVRAVLARANLERLAHELATRRLLALIGARAVEAAPDLMTPDFEQRVGAARTTARARGLAIEAETRRLTALLAGHEIRALPLKGPLLAELAHGDLGARDTRDVDLLVPRERLDDAVALLRAEDYAAPQDPLRRNGLPDIHFALAHLSRPAVELHWRIDFYDDGFSEDMLARAEPGPDGLLRATDADLAAALLLFYARDGFHGVRLAADIAGFSDRVAARLGPGFLAGHARRYPRIAAALTAAAEASERLTGAPACDWLGPSARADARARAAARLADWTQAESRDQLAANISLVDGLLTPPGSEGEFARRELVPRTGTAPAHAVKMLARYGYALWRVRGGREWAPVPDPRGRRRVELLGARIDPVTEAEAIAYVVDSLAREKGGWLVTLNVDGLAQVSRSRDTAELVSRADLVVADGMPLVWASSLARSPLPARVAGSDLVWSLTAESAIHDRSIFLLGGDPGVAERAALMMRETYPGLTIAGTHSPPFGFESDPAELDAIRARLREARPDVVYVALGFPKQERLIDAVREALPHAWFVGVGISFSFLSGDVPRAPDWLQRAGLEWAHRLSTEPRRLARRYLVEDVPVALRLFAHALGRGRRPAAGHSYSPVPPLGARAVFTHGAVERKRAEDLAALRAGEH